MIPYGESKQSTVFSKDIVRYAERKKDCENKVAGETQWFCLAEKSRRDRTAIKKKKSRVAKEGAMENNKMFCFQCEQTAACSGDAGVCGKISSVENLQDALTGAFYCCDRI